MPRARSARSDMSDGDVDGMAEKEMQYQKLQRQYRIMEGDRKAYCQESQVIIKKDRSEIERLEKEREELCTDLRQIESKSNETKDDKNCEDLGELGREIKSIEDQIEEEKKKIEDQKAETKEWEKKNKEQNKNMGGVHMSAAHNQQAQKNSRKMENQLQLSNNKFCKALEVNKKLREEIDSLRVARGNFDNLYKKLDKEKQQLQQSIGQVIDESTQAYDQRDEAQAKMILLKEKADKDLLQHNAEMKELCRIIDHDRKLREFMNTKGKEREEDPQLVAWRQRKEEMEAQRKKESQTDSVESYERAYQRIREITGEEDMDVIVDKFIREEDKNFALFNYVNEQNNLIEKLQDDIQGIQDDMDRFKAQGVELESQRKQILKSLEEKQSQSAKQADDNEDKHKGVMKILDQLKAGVDSLFNKINCDRSSIDDMLDSEPGMTYQNMLQHLGLIEEKTNHLLLVQAYINSKKELDDYRQTRPRLLGEGPREPTKLPNLHAPTIGDEYDTNSDEDDEDVKPYTSDELQAKVMKNVKKRENAMKGKEFEYDLSDAREQAKKKDKGKKH